MSAKTSALRQYRKNKGWTLEEASKRFDVSLSYLSELETGEATPSKALAEKLSKKTGLSPAAIMGWEGAA